MVKKLMPLLLLSLAMAGCSTTEVTSVTSRHELRNQNGFYPVEAAFNSSQQSLRWDSIKTQVIVEDKDTYPMHLTPMMTNRWETLIPVPPNVNVVYYRFKFDYKYNAFGGPRPDSKLSQIYRLQIIDK